MKFLIVRLGALGDIVHALPVAAAIRAHSPGAQIDWLVDARHAPLLSLVPVINRIIVVGRARPGGPDPGSDARALVFQGASAVPRAVAALRSARYDAAIDLQGLLKSGVWARLSFAARVIGFESAFLRERAAGIFYTDRVNPGGVRHVVFKNIAVLGALGVPAGPPRFPIEPPDSGVVADVRRRLGPGAAESFAIVNPAGGWPNKRWPPERFGAVASEMARRHHLRTVVLWGPGERPLADQVVASSGGAAIPGPETTLADVFVLAKAARLFVGGDSGPLHFAAAVGTPTVGLFGPTDPLRNGSWNADDEALSRYNTCECHYRRRCVRPRACLEEISVEDVVEAIDRRLDRA